MLLKGGRYVRVFEKVGDQKVFFADYLEKGLRGLGTDSKVSEVEVQDGVDDCAVFCLGACDVVIYCQEDVLGSNIVWTIGSISNVCAGGDLARGDMV